jgi:hypothetical protein
MGREGGERGVGLACGKDSFAYLFILCNNIDRDISIDRSIPFQSEELRIKCFFLYYTLLTTKKWMISGLEWIAAL